MRALFRLMPISIIFPNEIIAYSGETIFTNSGSLEVLSHDAQLLEFQTEEYPYRPKRVPSIFILASPVKVCPDYRS